MVAPTAGAVVLVPFPFSDLSQTKLRPAVILADSGRGDWILCQVTSNPYGDAQAVEITNDSFESGSLRVTSYARPGKLFTANQDLMVSQVAVLNDTSLRTIIEAVVDILSSGLNTPVQ
ncbi:MAG: type II toxin-antitoxin system PemK/MazF family toxin [Desulfomonilaceae bacterium]|nr:type II toxin-antitoxin system PemK/MazF family toxin [Desulfomonilaceae bacterium]